MFAIASTGVTHHFRRVCSNGLVRSQGSFDAIRFRHSKLETDGVMRAGFRLLEFVPRVGERAAVARALLAEESIALAA